METKVCNHCGIEKELDKFPNRERGKIGKGSYCKICMQEKYKILLTCECCGEEFKTKHKGSRFCSFKCSNAQFNKQIDYNCDFCGKESKQTNFEYNRYKNHYCSLECKNNHRSELYSGENAPMYGKIGLRGENSPLWKPNLTQEDRERNRRIDGYCDFIKKVYARDNYTCQCCGKSSDGDIVAHHLNGYNWDKENRTNIDNGITLCENCHNEFHNLYGRGNNTKEQFKEWLNNKNKTSA